MLATDWMDANAYFWKLSCSYCISKGLPTTPFAKVKDAIDWDDAFSIENIGVVNMQSNCQYP